jgi:hypothetical protein
MTACTCRNSPSVQCSQSRPKPDLIKKLSRRLRGSPPLPITLVDLVFAKQTIPIMYSAGWAERRTVPAGIESPR